MKNNSQLIFNLNNTNLNENDFKFLIGDLLIKNKMVNGYVLYFEYDFHEGIVALTPCFKKIK